MITNTYPKNRRPPSPLPIPTPLPTLSSPFTSTSTTPLASSPCSPGRGGRGMSHRCRARTPLPPGTRWRPRTRRTGGWVPPYRSLPCCTFCLLFLSFSYLFLFYSFLSYVSFPFLFWFLSYFAGLCSFSTCSALSLSLFLLPFSTWLICSSVLPFFRPSFWPLFFLFLRILLSCFRRYFFPSFFTFFSFTLVYVLTISFRSLTLFSMILIM